MADSETTTPLPENRDAELLRLGRRHMALMRVYAASEDLFAEDAPDVAMDAITARLLELENRIAHLPAHTLPGIRVRLWALWSLYRSELSILFTGPKPEDASAEALLIWGVLQDAERLLAHA